ncbi:MAG: sulfite exporter TauE/SafE family protein [Candidatus Zixiibacteriota bacterium]|nr:MAG: sulfite exporter TauE/SafE family protein [candidate division Zixibacteria bacterium]
MEYIIISLAAIITSGLTLFSGFGLGTLLMPVFAIFFPVDIAIGLTAVVHLFNNLFKFVLLGTYVDKTVALKFGLPAIIAAFFGARFLISLSDLKPLLSYYFFGHEFMVMPVKLVIAILMVLFSLFEIMPRLGKLTFENKYLPFGGILSGFFGGLSGHQGALRSAFLIKCGLSKEGFIATGVVIACFVDISRIFIYSTHLSLAEMSGNTYILLTAIIAAFSGAFIGNRLIKKVTMRTVQLLVSIMIFGIAIGLGSGII